MNWARLPRDGRVALPLIPRALARRWRGCIIKFVSYERMDPKWLGSADSSPSNGKRFGNIREYNHVSDHVSAKSQLKRDVL